MTDEKKLPDLGEIDWDEALSEWENKSFAPQVAKDAATDKPGALSGGGASRPLYRPPSAEASPQPKSPPVRPPPVELPSLAEDTEGSATRIAVVPAELLRGEDPAPKGTSRGGGLGPLFAREEKRDPSEASIEVSFPTSRPFRRGSALVDEAVTSAKSALVPPGARPADSVPPRRGASVDSWEVVPEAAIYDSVAEPTPGSTRATERPPPDPNAASSSLEDWASAAKALPSDSPPPGHGPPLHVPVARRYDPKEETSHGDAGASARARGAIDDALDHQRAAAADGPAVQSVPDIPGERVARERVFSPPLMRTWPNEKPSTAWLDDGARAALEARATWLEEEARQLGDKVARGRALLVCSELAATIGQSDRARALALEARDLAPTLALSHRQARATTLPGPVEGSEGWLEAIDLEVKMTPSGPARLHSTLMAAGALRASGDYDAAGKRFDQAARISAADVRAALARAVRALGRDETTSAALRMPESLEFAPIASALAAGLRLRGVDRKDTARVGDPTPNELLLRARQSLDKGDVAAAASLVAQLAEPGNVPELGSGALWLAASMGATRPGRRADAMRWLRQLVERGDEEARRALLARAIETDERDVIAEALTAGGSLTSAERVTLANLAGIPLLATDPHLHATASAPGMQALASAASALAMPDSTRNGDRAAQVLARAALTAGYPASRALVRLGRLLSEGAPAAEIDSAIAALDDRASPAVRAMRFEMMVRGGKSLDVSMALEAWGAERGSSDERTAGALASALFAERAGERERACEAFKAARVADPTNESALRAVGSFESVDLVAELNALADELGEGSAGAVARLEAVSRGENALPDPTRADLLERAHRAAPSIPIAGFLAERIGRREGDVERVLRWVRERRAHTLDPIEAALDAVREALFVADSEPSLAAERLLEAHRARPSDVALRELYERMAAEAPEDNASWREQRGVEVSGDARTLFFLEAALDYERQSDDSAALRAAQSAAAADATLGKIARERAEMRSGSVARLGEELLATAKSATNSRERREAYDRLALLDAMARKDPASALLWHRTILEEQPDHAPSLRYVEHHLIGEGRDEELEPIATAIAHLLRKTGAGECTAHAELAARLRLRGAAGDWDATRDMVELAASEGEASLWALRMLQAHSRGQGDDATYLSATLRLLERSTRPAEEAALLILAAEANARLGKLDEARSLLERAATDDPGDVVAWGLLADVRRRAGDARGAAEAHESLARSSLVREHQLVAWYDAGRIWQDEARDEERAIVALEAAAAIEVDHRDVFDRLSHIYAARKMLQELSRLLERRITGVTDPAERLAMEVRRGRVLLDVGETEGARVAFEAALAQKPDDAGALSAFADLCVAQRDWDAAEQALVRLARQLPTPEEQRDVYSRLGDLYARHLVNLSRAEVAFKEVLKRAPGDFETLERLVDVYRRQNDSARAAELQQDLITRARSPEEKRQRLVELSMIHEQTGHDNRRAEQALEAARREFPQDAGVLRALFAFYGRHNQTPAVNVMLDRASSDARRALAAGRFAPGLFEVLAAVFELRGKHDAAQVTQAMLAALEGRPSEVRGAAERAFDPRLDDLLAPEVLTPAMRSLLRKTGDALDLASPIDLRSLKAVAVPPENALARFANGIGQAIGVGPVQMFVSPKLGAACLPIGSSPAAIILGEAPTIDERAQRFMVLRALKLVHAKASAFARTPPAELAVLVSAWLKCFNPSWQPQGIAASALNAATGRLQAALPRNVDSDVGVIALEVAGNIGTQAATLGPASLAWANRTALLAMGDMNAAIDAIAASSGMPVGAPSETKERATWLARTSEARDLLGFGVSEAFADLRARLALDK